MIPIQILTNCIKFKYEKNSINAQNFFLFFFFSFFLFFNKNTQAQDNSPCYALTDCEKLKIEVVKVNSNVSSGCATISTCGNDDNFYQVVYKVYLRYQSSSVLTLPFKLEYSRMNVALALKSTGSFSYIDATATELCYKQGPGIIWNNPVDVGLIINQKDITQSFSNQSSSLACGDTHAQIKFNLSNPPLVASAPPYCYYAELFSIVVNTFPGESISIAEDENVTEFVAFDDEPGNPGNQLLSCHPIGKVNTGNNNGIFNNIIASFAQDPSMTPNRSLLLSIGSPASSGTVSGGVEYPIKLTNNSTQALDISFLQFAVNVSTSVNTGDLQFTGLMPEIEAQNGTTKRLHYLHKYSTPSTVAGGATLDIGSIIVTGPTLTNLIWTSTVSIITNTINPQLPQTTRVKTAGYCTQLPIDLGIKTFTGPMNGSPQCTDPGWSFRVAMKNTMADLCTGTVPIVKAGFEIANNGQLILEGLKFDIEFDVQGGQMPTSVSFSDWVSGFSCDNDTDPDCYSPCWQISGNKVSFCYRSTGSNPQLLYINGSVYINILFNNATGCINGATVTMLEIKPFGQPTCIPLINTTANGLPACPPVIKGRVSTETTDLPLEEATVTLTPSSGTCSTQTTLTTNPTDQVPNYGFCPDAACTYTVTPTKDDNPLNGVSTYDLVLISKHILGIEPLGSPYKLIAADANKSNSITTFDIVTIRKLILGIQPDFSFVGNTSWRFIPKDYVINNPSNPFQQLNPPTTPFPSTITNLLSNSIANFVALKVGDVNNTAIANARPANRPISSIDWSIPMKKGPSDLIEVPVVYTGQEALEGLQLGLRFDPAQLQFVSTGYGTVPGFNADCFNLSATEQGVLKAVWVLTDTERRIQTGDVLFYLLFRAKSNRAEADNLLSLDDALLENLVWRADDTECSLIREAATQTRTEIDGVSAGLQVESFPNPGLNTLQFKIQSKLSGKARLALYDAFGKRVLLQVLMLDGANQTLEIQQSSALPAGMYNWKIWTGDHVAQGRWVKAR
jgi:hypothetical protein